MSSMNWVSLTLAGVCCAVAGCSESRDNVGREGASGRIELAVGEVPSGVRCLRLIAVAASGATAERDYVVTAGLSVAD